MQRPVFAGLLAALSCACSGPEVHSIVQIDRCSTSPSPDPVYLRADATLVGAANALTGSGYLDLTVERVVSPREFIVRGAYGLDRVRPVLSAATLALLSGQHDCDAEIRSRLATALDGRHLLEVNTILAPVVSDDGLRVAWFWLPDLQPLDDYVRGLLDDLPQAAATDVVDLSPVPRNAGALRDRAAAVVELAEGHSSMRAPWNLSVTWATPSELPPLSSPLYAEWWHEVGQTFYAQETPLDDPTWSVLSLPGGHVFVRPDHDWRESELQDALLRALVRQYQYALCAAGRVTFKDRAGLLVMEAHASSMAHEIEREAGESAEAIALAREWDLFSPATQVFDRYRAGLGLSPDEALFRLAAHPDEAKQLHHDVYIGMNDRVEKGPLAFEYAGRSDGTAVVTVINTTAETFSGFSNGWWHLVPKGSASWTHAVGGTPFALRLPPHGRVTLRTDLAVKPDEDVAECFVPYAQAPAAVEEVPR